MSQMKISHKLTFVKTKNKTMKTALFSYFYYLGELLVELAGIEPASAQGNHTLSTRLFWTSFSSVSKTQTTN